MSVSVLRLKLVCVFCFMCPLCVNRSSKVRSQEPLVRSCPQCREIDCFSVFTKNSDKILCS